MARRWRVLLIGNQEAREAHYKPLWEVADLDEAPAQRPAVLAKIGQADAVLTGLTVIFDDALMATAPNLRVISFAATGRDHVDLAAAERRGIKILCLKEETEFLRNVTATAELAWGLLLASVRKIPWAFDAAKSGKWRGFDGPRRGHQLSGKTLGVLGYGRLGTIVADYGLAFRMKVLACDTRPVRAAPGITQVDHDTLYRQADVLSIHIHLQGNEKFIGREAFAKFKKGTVLVNTSRGGVIDEQAFVEALNSGQVGAAGVDVIEGEWSSNLAEHPLIRYAREHENLVITPHIGGVTVESQAMTRDFIIQKLADYLRAMG
jgi:D-3-phosphoglycerate dehydrogenase